jgi:hypothetical protein
LKLKVGRRPAQNVPRSNRTGILTEKVRESRMVALVVVTRKPHDVSEPNGPSAILEQA